jgi:hypothetical protein
MRVKDVFESITKYFSSEELFFGLATIMTVVTAYSSVVPAISTLLLLAFYYFFFGWFMFRKERKTNFLFSIVAGIVYSVCLVCIATIIVGGNYNLFFYVTQIVVLVVFFSYLKRIKRIESYKTSHYVRIGIILALNLYIFIFK